MTFNGTISNLTIISVALGIFFLSAAFYKSIFHRRRSQAKNASPTSFRSDDPVKLGDPFQPLTDAPLSNAEPFRGSPPNSAPTVLAFRQVAAAWGGGVSGNGSAKTETYEWE